MPKSPQNDQQPKLPPRNPPSPQRKRIRPSHRIRPASQNPDTSPQILTHFPAILSIQANSLLVSEPKIDSTPLKTPNRHFSPQKSWTKKDRPIPIKF